MGFGAELLFLVVLGFLLFEPKKLPAIFRKLARSKAQLRHVTDTLTSHLDTALEPEGQQAELNLEARTDGRQ